MNMKNDKYDRMDHTGWEITVSDVIEALEKHGIYKASGTDATSVKYMLVNEGCVIQIINASAAAVDVLNSQGMHAMKDTVNSHWIWVSTTQYKEAQKFLRNRDSNNLETSRAHRKMMDAAISLINS